MYTIIRNDLRQLLKGFRQITINFQSSTDIGIEIQRSYHICGKNQNAKTYFFHTGTVVKLGEPLVPTFLETF